MSFVQEHYLSDINFRSMKFGSYKVSQKKKIELYKSMLYPRMIEEKMLLLLRQGKISKWFSGIGQEAIAVGVTSILEEDEIVFPMHRNLGVFTTRNIPLHRLYAQWQGVQGSFTKGRDRSFHFGSLDHNIVGMISHLGPQLSLACGVGLSHKLRSEPALSVAFTGEGGTSEGEFHEALNVAAVWKLPVIFVVENNGYGLSTPTTEQYACAQIADKGIGYGMKSVVVDGNNILDVYTTLSKIAAKVRKKPEPYLVECMTFRMRGHEEASGTKYVPKKLMAKWAKKDPIINFEASLLKNGVLSSQDIETCKEEFTNQIQEELNKVEQAKLYVTTESSEELDVFKESETKGIEPGQKSEDMRFIDAISDGLHCGMREHTEMVLMGQDIAEYGGVFKITNGFTKSYGKDRVRNTPICESAIIGAGLGLSLKGIKSVIEMQFADFATCGFNQIVNNLAKLYYRWGEAADVVIRMPCGGSVGAGPFHSQTNEAWFTHVPGLKVVYPSNPADAKGLLLAAMDDPNPVLYFEHKALYRSKTGEVPTGYYHTPIGQARLVHEGEAVSIITYGLGVHWALDVVEKEGINADVLDLRTLNPIDYEAIGRTVKKTNRVLILHEDTLFGGLGGELSAYISEHLFEHLDAPIVRVGSLNTPVPFAKNIEEKFLASYRLKDKLEQLMNY